MRTSRSDHYISCLNCHQVLRVRYPVRSCQTLDQWSDTFLGMELKGFCDLSACPKCNHAFWVSDQERLDKIAEPTVRDLAYGQGIILASGWHGITVPFDESTLPEHGELFVQPASNRQMIVALASPSLPEDRVRYLRTTLWHNANHPQRGFLVDPNDAIPEEFRLANLQWLLSRYETKPSDDRDVVIEGELLREQGLFDAAIKRMDYALLCGSTRALSIKQQALAKNAAVCIMREGGEPVIY